MRHITVAADRVNTSQRFATIQLEILLTDSYAEQRLVQAAKGGDRAAFGRLYEKYARMVHGVLVCRASFSEVDDLMQEVFLQALRRIETLRTEDAFGAWLASIARNIAASHHRSKRPGEELEDPAGHSGGSAAAEAAEVLRILQELPEAYRETLALRLVEGMTGPEIAERTGLKHGSVRVNLSRGMELLRNRLDGVRKGRSE